MPGRRSALSLLAVAAAAAGGVLLGGGANAAATALITGRDIKDGSITRADLAPSARGLRGHRGPRGRDGLDGVDGPPGVSGPVGPTGPAGAAGTVSGVRRVAATVMVPAGGANAIGLLYAHCPAGSGPIAGGFAGVGTTFISTVTADGWVIGYDDYYGTTTSTAEADVLCAPGVTVTAAQTTPQLRDLVTSIRASRLAPLDKENAR